MAIEWQKASTTEGQRQRLIRDYLAGRISIGRFAELAGIGYEQARDWLHRRGIATVRKFTDPELERAERENYRRLLSEMESLG